MSPLGQRRILQVNQVSQAECRLDGEELGDLLLPPAEVPAGTVKGDALEVIVLRGSKGEWFASTRLPLACVGEFACLKVLEFNLRVGAYLDWGNGRELFLPRREVPAGTRAGYALVVGVIADPSTAQISATTRIESLLNREPAPYVEGQRVRVLVANETPLGFKTIVENSHWGLLYKSNLGSVLKQGSELDAYVKSVRPDGKLDLLLDSPGYGRVQPLAEQILEAVKNSKGRLLMGDHSTPDEIRDKFGVSKKAFKQAVGKLYRERKVVLGDGWIEALRIWILLVCVFLFLGRRVEGARVDYSREVRPLLADACFRCHGQDAAARKAGLRLDVREVAIQPAKSGAVAIVPGKPDQSELVRRLMIVNGDDVMPPPETHKQLEPSQKALLKRWIAEGAEYKGHWAFEMIKRPAVPDLSGIAGHWNRRNSVDTFIQASLVEHGLEPAREAVRSKLIRRVTLDLTGLPPSLEEIQRFIEDQDEDAYERLVERLLRSPRYGERMANDWLDVARYADSNGYQVDRDREMWPWRDWVVSAFNRNMPFDQFTVEQIAGDLLSEPTLDQRIATGFHRNHMINEEGGIIPEEFLAEYCSDRVETTATTWLGLTFNCARCHDHKYDPVTQKDYYRLYAFFHNNDEKGVGDYGAPYRRSTPPFLKLPTPNAEAKMRELQARMDIANEAVTSAKTILSATTAEWESAATAEKIEWSSGLPLRVKSESTNASAHISQTSIRLSLPPKAQGLLTADIRFSVSQFSALRVEWLPAGNSISGSTNVLASLRELRAVRMDGLTTNAGLNLRAGSLPGTTTAEELSRTLDAKPDTAWQVKAGQPMTQVGIFQMLQPLIGSGQVLIHLEFDWATEGNTNATEWSLSLSSTASPSDRLLPSEIAAILKRSKQERSEDEKKKLDEFRWSLSLPIRDGLRAAEQLGREIRDLDSASPVTLVMSELSKPRETFVHMRGAYDRLGDRVEAGTPIHLPPMAEGFPRNRLGLARWLVDRSNPLTARVFVNRLWQAIFGAGLVRTPEDFGAQGEYPTHPELLDWLASEFMDRGWDVQALVRSLVLSATYRQDSVFGGQGGKLDPDNRWLARGPRGRLSAEAIRDQALAVSGLLVGELGGPAVRPYHPPGLYEQVVAGSSADTYVQDHGSSLYRRTLYTYWKRSVPNPALLVFDRPFRETCAVRRSRTSTPLQALNLMNDPTYVEAARQLGLRMIREGGTTVDSRIRRGFLMALGRLPSPTESKILLEGWYRTTKGFESDNSGANQLTSIGESTVPAGIDRVELAAYTVTAGTLLNLDETLNKE